MQNPTAKRREYSKSILSIIVCPNCSTDLILTESGMYCNRCSREYPYAETGAIDLRLKAPRSYCVEYHLESPLVPEGLEVAPLKTNPNPEVDFTDVIVPYHMSPELMSYFPKPRMSGAKMLDLGCGDTLHQNICEHAGFEYVGLDYYTPEAPILGDGHSLPFSNESFEFVLSIAVLEHIRFPSVMVSEVQRVLQKGGLFIGSVSFLEPFHGDSFYHHTHLGVINTLGTAGFEILKVAPTARWPVLVAQANMGLFPKMPPFLSNALVLPLHLLHKLWWRIGRMLDGEKAHETVRIRNTTGSFTFIARKK